MRKLAILTIGLALLGACKSEDKVVVEPANFQITIDEVGSTKVSFTVKSSNPDATYLHLAVGSWEDNWYPLTDKEVAKDYLGMIVRMDQSEDITQENKVSQFQDRYCYKGDRSFHLQFLGRDMDYRVIVFQIDPFAREVVGNPVSVPFHTHPIPSLQLDFDAQLEGDALTITPSDNALSYYWDYETADYFWGDLASSVYYYLYEVTDMYEKYGFIDQVLSKGPQTYVFSEQDKGMVEGETFIVSAVGYANHELATDPQIWAFEYHETPGKSILRAVTAPQTKAPAPLQQPLSAGRRFRKSR